MIEDAFACDIHVRGNEITISGDRAEVDLASSLFEELITLLERGDVLTADAVQRSTTLPTGGGDERVTATEFTNARSAAPAGPSRLRIRCAR